MRFFFLQDYRHWLLGLFLGIILAVLIYLALRSYRYSTERSGEEAGETFRYPDGIEGRDFPPPLFLVLLVVSFAVWMVCYVIYVGILGGPI